jgi:hypothetical protein
VTTGGDHTSVEVIVGLIFTYPRDVQCLNNSIRGSDVWDRDLKVEINVLYLCRKKTN